MQSKCSLDDPTKRGMPEIYACPKCGDEVEVWSDEKKGKCPTCNAVLLREDLNNKISQ